MHLRVAGGAGAGLFGMIQWQADGFTEPPASLSEQSGGTQSTG